ncbi:MAG: hypothetical protein LUG58_00475 [Clostridiales bacterium]|nr:hypothetical protein [Clostridiales bacterium]
MTEETKKEIIKAFAYDYTPEEVAEMEGMTVEEATAFREENMAAIAEKAEELSEAGWLG